MKISSKPKYHQLEEYQYCIMTAVTCVSTKHSQKHCTSDMYVLQSQWSKSVSKMSVLYVCIQYRSNTAASKCSSHFRPDECIRTDAFF